jgi:hypothetical protein
MRRNAKSTGLQSQNGWKRLKQMFEYKKKKETKKKTILHCNLEYENVKYALVEFDFPHFY